MNYLSVCRHAKAETATNGVLDIQRNLIEKGKLTLHHQVTKFAKQTPSLPDIIVCSHSNRTRQSAEIFSEILKLSNTENVLIDPKLYLADAFTCFEIIQTFENFNHVLLIGHNPGISDLFQLLTQKKALNLRTSEMYILKPVASNQKFFQPLTFINR